MTLLGSFGKVQTPYFDDPNRDDFVRGAADKFVFEGLKEVGEIHCIELQAGGDDWWLFDSVSKGKILLYYSIVLTKKVRRNVNLCQLPCIEKEVKKRFKNI